MTNGYHAQPAERQASSVKTEETRENTGQEPLVRTDQDSVRRAGEAATPAGRPEKG